MSTYQHRISFKGTEDSIDHFTKLLRDLKAIFGVNSAEILLSAASNWMKRPLASHVPRCNAQTRAGCSRIFYLQVLTTAFVVSRLNTELERLRRDPTLKLILEPHRVGRQEFLLEALIVVLEFYRSSPTSTLDLPMASSGPGNSVSSCFGLAHHRDLDVDKNTVPSWRQKLEDNVNESSRIAAKYLGSKSSHQLVLNNSAMDKPATVYQNKNLAYQLTNRNTPVDILDRARCRSVEIEPENRHLTSWRQRLREQQLAENRRLTESVRTRSSVSRTGSEDRTEMRSSPIETGPSDCILTCKHTEQLGNKNHSWRPLHESAIEAAQRGSFTWHCCIGTCVGL